MTKKPAQTDKQDAARAISKWLSDGDELDHCCACRSLGVLGDHHSVPALVDRLRDEDIDVCIDAAEALGQIGDTRAVAPLVESLNTDPDGDVKTMVVKALGRLGGEQAISQLLELAISPPEDDEWDDDVAWDPNWDIQIEAVHALGQLRVAAAVTPLSELLDDSECQVDKSNLFNALAHIGNAGEQLLIQRLQEDTPRERRRAAGALGIACSAIGARALGRALQDPEPEVRAAAANALTSGNHDRYLSALLLLLRDPSDEVRETALRAVNKLTSNSTGTTDAGIELEKLLPLLDDTSPQVRAAVLKILHSRLTEPLGDHIQTRVRELLADPNPIVAAAACPLAVMLDDPQSEQSLLSLAMNPQADTTVRQQAILALGQRGNASETVLMSLTEVLNTQDAVILFAALQALLALHTQGAASYNESGNQSSNENDADETLPTPLEIILAALRGEVISPPVMEPEVTKPEPTDSEPPTEELTAEDAAADSGKVDSGEVETSEEPDNVEPENVAPVSTLDSIALGNIELAQQIEAGKQLNPDDIPEHPPEELEDYQSYYDILKQQKYNRKKFTRNKTVNIANEMRRLSARILGKCSEPEVVKALAEAIHDEDPGIQREAIDALARITPSTPGITETLGPLTSFLHLGNADLRIVSARALGALGNLETLPSLLNCLEDEDLLVRNQSVLAVGKLLKSYAEQSSKTNPLLVANKRAQKKAASVERALRSLVDHLNDTDAGVRKATALIISELSPLFLSGESSDELRNEIIEQLISAGFASGGEQARDMGIALRTLDPAVAGDHLIHHLDNLPSSFERRFAIEMLEEIFRPAQAA